MTKRPEGRPSKYDPKYGEDIVALATDGASLLECALEIGVSKQTLFNWGEEHPEFLDALNRAKAKRQIWWERVHRSCASTGTGNAASIMFGLKNIAPDDYKDNIGLNHGGQKDNPIKVVVTPEENEL
jgi:hypothetical protein